MITLKILWIDKGSRQFNGIIGVGFELADDFKRFSESIRNVK